MQAWSFDDAYKSVVLIFFLYVLGIQTPKDLAE